MEKIGIQLLLTEDEYEALQKEAHKSGLTVPLFIKETALEKINFGSDFGVSYSKLIEKVSALKSETEFNIRMLFGVEWTMSKGVKLNLGKTYYTAVSEGVIDNVIPIGKDSSNVMWYRKK